MTSEEVKQFTVICNGIILLAMNHFSSCVIPYNGNWKSILICALLSTGRGDVKMGQKEKWRDSASLVETKHLPTAC